MSKYLAPLVIFVMGSLILLVAYIFMPAIGVAGEQLAAETAGVASTFWGWSWIVGGVKFWVFLMLWFAVLYATVRAFLKVR